MICASPLALLPCAACGVWPAWSSQCCSLAPDDSGGGGSGVRRPRATASTWHGWGAGQIARIPLCLVHPTLPPMIMIRLAISDKKRCLGECPIAQHHVQGTSHLTYITSHPSATMMPSPSSAMGHHRPSHRVTPPAIRAPLSALRALVVTSTVQALGWQAPPSAGGSPPPVLHIAAFSESTARSTPGGTGRRKSAAPQAKQ